MRNRVPVLTSAHPSPMREQCVKRMVILLVTPVFGPPQCLGASRWGRTATGSDSLHTTASDRGQYGDVSAFGASQRERV